MRHRLPFVAALLIASVTTKAQTKLDLSGLWDNWYVGANTGFNSKLTHNSFMGHLNPHLTLRAGRDIIPLVGVIVEATPFFNDQKFPYARLGYTDLYSKTGVKALNLHVLGNLNLHNLIMDYEGEPRLFEAHFIAGFGLNHVFGTDVGSKNDLVSKIGFDLSLVFGDAKEWLARTSATLRSSLWYEKEASHIRPSVIPMSRSSVCGLSADSEIAQSIWLSMDGTFASHQPM